MTRWRVHGERPIYTSDWISLNLADVELPDGERFEHHVVRYAREATGVAVTDPERGVLLIWRHRFVNDSWGWEVPAGLIEPGESPAQAGARETLEETGWRPGPLEPLGSFYPTNGSSNARFHLFTAKGAEEAGEPADRSEVERVEWVAPARVRELIERSAVPDGLSLTALLWAIVLQRL